MSDSLLRLAWARALVAALLTFLLAPGARAEAVVRLAAIDHEPYIGATLPDQGYLAELATAAFARSGYTVQIDFYPPERARLLAERGEVDGWLPVHASPANQLHFALSAPMPGDHLGLLKRRDTPLTLPRNAARQPTAALQRLAGLRVGVSRGSLPGEAADAVSALPTEWVARDVQNLDKLAHRRIDVAVIDKYLAADLMALQRPQYIGKLEFVPPVLYQSPFHLAFPLGNTRHAALRNAFNAGLKAVEQDGTLERILARHGLAGPARAEGRTTRLTIGTVNNPDMQVMQRLSRHFEHSHPGVRIEWRVLEENILRRRTLSDLALADGQFDVITIGPNEAQTWREGWLTPLTGLPASYDLDDVLPNVRAQLTVNNQLYALPFYAESSMTYYRADLFRQAELVMPARPTIKDIEEFASRLHKPEAGQYGLCLRGQPGWGENMAVVSTLANTFGARWFRPDWMPELNTPEWQRAVSWYVDMLRRYGPPNPERNGFNENLRLFADGHCAIWIDATVAAGRLYNPRESKVANALGYAPAPVKVTIKGSHWLWTWALAIPASTTHRQLARDFIDWATSKEYVRLVAAEEGWVAAPPGTRRSTYDDPAYRKAAPFARFVLAAIDEANPRDPTLRPVPYTGIQVLSIPEYPAIGNLVGQEIAHALTGRQTPTQALQRAQSSTFKQMRDSGYLP